MRYKQKSTCQFLEKLCCPKWRNSAAEMILGSYLSLLVLNWMWRLEMHQPSCNHEAISLRVRPKKPTMIPVLTSLSTEPKSPNFYPETSFPNIWKKPSISKSLLNIFSVLCNLIQSYTIERIYEQLRKKYSSLP